jgi:hypothetical protein
MNPSTQDRILTGLRAKLSDLTPGERRMLLVAIEGLHERAYRRGFQHGTVYFANHPDRTEADVSRWRHSDVTRQATPPPGTGARMPSCRRMLAESRDVEHDILQALIEREAGPHHHQEDQQP